MSKKGSKIWDVIIVGAGASGMMAAITAARRGKSVLLLEHLQKPGKKLLATGNGKCNYTNAHMKAECYHGNPDFIERILRAFSHEDCVSFFRELGIYPKQKNGYFYPNSGQASSVLNALEMELARAKVCLVTEVCLQEIKPEQDGFVCKSSKETYRGRSVILATGLLASPRLGSDGSAFPLIKSLGHQFRPILPALCGFYSEGMDFRKVAGVRCDAGLTLIVNGREAGYERGELQLTDYGVSGIPVFQLSSTAARALHDNKQVQLRLNFLPDLDWKEVLDELYARQARAFEGEQAEQLLCGLIHQKLGVACLNATRITAQANAVSFKPSTIKRIARVLTDYPVRLFRVRETEFAQVCAGGVCTKEIDIDTLESRLCPGLYFAGELLDVDGICGGYNLQWAWSTGYVAGSSIP